MIPKSHFNLLLALSLFFLSFLAYIYVTQQYQIQLLQYQLLKLQPPTPILSPTPSPVSSSATSTWQTYKNSQYGFEFKYPSNFLVEQNASEITVWDNKNKPTRPLQDNWPGKFFTIKYETISQPFSISNWLAVHESFSEFKQVDKDETKLWLGEYVAKKIGSNEFFLFRSDGPGANDGYILVNSESLLYFSSPEGDELFTDQTYNQILSTFKFTN